MRIDYDLLKVILEAVANVGYESSVRVSDLAIEDDDEHKLDFHVVHLIAEGYLAGEIIPLEGGRPFVVITRITDKGMLMLNTIENSAFQKFVEAQGNRASSALWGTGSSVMSSLTWALAKQFWLPPLGVQLL